MSQTIVTLPAVTVAYFRHTGPYGDPAIGRIWGQLHDWANGRGLWTDQRVCYGISHDSPMDTPPERCRYDACIEIPQGFVIDSGAAKANLPGGVYARDLFHGKPTDIPIGLGRVLREVIPALGREFDFTRPLFELYRGDFKMDADGSFSCDLCVPVK